MNDNNEDIFVSWDSDNFVMLESKSLEVKREQCGRDDYARVQIDLNDNDEPFELIISWYEERLDIAKYLTLEQADSLISLLQASKDKLAERKAKADE